MRKLSFLLTIYLLCTILLPPIPVSADKADKYSNIIGVRQTSSHNSDVTYTGKHYTDSKGHEQYEYNASFYSVPIYNDDGTQVDSSWHGHGNSYSITNNIFSATVSGASVIVTYQGQTLTWNPIVFVDSTEYDAKGKASISSLNKKNPLGNNYNGNILEWDYGVCIRRITVTEGSVQEEWIFNSNPKGTVWVKDNDVKSAGFIWAVAPYANDANGSPLVINQYKQVMASEFDKAVFPVTIDPTLNFYKECWSPVAACLAQDGIATYAAAWTADTGTPDGHNYVGQVKATTYSVFRGVWVFNTSSIADSATITGACFNVSSIPDDESATDFILTLQHGISSTYPHACPVVGDYNKSLATGSDGTLSTTGIAVGSKITLNTSGLAQIDKTGWTKFYLRSSRDIAGTAPTGLEYIDINWIFEVTYTVSAPIVVTYSPATSITAHIATTNGSITDNGGDVISERGICYANTSPPTTTNLTSHDHTDALGNFSMPLTGLNYNTLYYYRAYGINSNSTAYGATYNFTTAPLVAPTITTINATYITKTTARLNGYLSADGGEACNVSFLYALWNGSAWGTNSSTSNQSKITGDSFYADIVSLVNNSTYREMAVASNTVGISYGSWLNFSTLNTISAPSSILCSASSDSIALSWMNNGSSQVYIRYKTGTFPTSPTDGYAIANQSGYVYIHTGLIYGTSYYYTLWGLDGGNLSTAYAQTMCTTTASFATSTPAPLPTTNMSGWSNAPNGSVLSNNPLYGLGNQEASAMGIPQGTWWLLLGMGGLVVCGLFIYSRTSNLLLSMIAMIVFGVIMAQASIFPIWTMMIFGLAGIGFAWKELR